MSYQRRPTLDLHLINARYDLRWTPSAIANTGALIHVYITNGKYETDIIEYVIKNNDTNARVSKLHCSSKANNTSIHREESRSEQVRSKRVTIYSFLTKRMTPLHPSTVASLTSSH